MYTCGGHIIRKANPGLVTVEDSLIKGDDGGISKHLSLIAPSNVSLSTGVWGDVEKLTILTGAPL